MPDFFLVKDIHDVIMHAKFGDDRLRGLGVVAGQISAFPIDFAGRPYNTLTLPCERVILKKPTALHMLLHYLCETLMSAKQATNDTLQGSLATYLRCS